MRPHASTATLVDVIRHHAAERGKRVACELLPSSEHAGLTLTYEELDARACAIAGQLRARGASEQPVLVLCPAGLDYVAALFGCFYAGAVAVPAYPPTRTSLARTLPRLTAIAADAGAKWALVASEVGELGASALSAALACVELLEICREAAADPDARSPSADQPALLQYTSGSTASPKGVLLSHAQLLANLEMIRASRNINCDDVFLSWLPPYHDMGLIGAIFAPLFAGARSVLMPPEAFIRRPRSWLAAVREREATTLLAPNFAFDLCVKRIAPEARTGLDLSSVRSVFNGAEPIRAATLDAFTQAFAPYGFRPEAFYPCYGMAEATLIISGGASTSAPIAREYLAGELERGRAAPATRARGAEKTRRLVGCGRSLLDERIAIVDPSSQRILPLQRVGEIWLQSRSVAIGYWNRPEETERTFHAHTAENEGPFLRTGDLGFFDEDGELFVTGRLKDLIIVRGLNHYPHDIERTLQGMDDALVAGAGAAFSVDQDGYEQLIVVQELDKRVGADPDALIGRIAQAIREEHDITPAAIVLIKRGSMRKTSSGKLQRRATRAAYLADELLVAASWSASVVESRQVAADEGDSAQSPAAGGPAASDAPPARTYTRPIVHRREQMISDWLRAHLADKLRCDPDAIDPHEPLARYGVDSLVAAELTEELELWLGIQLPSALSYDYPTIAGLSRALAALHADPARPQRATPQRIARSAALHDEPIAIVGMACRFPGAPSLKAFWALLRHGVDAVTEVPVDRWDANALYDPEPGVRGKICSKWGGFVERIDEFDASFFGINAREAARIDPQQRMFLEVAWEALEDAGQSPSALAGSRSGVFAGVCTGDYATLYGGDLGLIDADYGTGNAASIIANRLSYFLDLKGPSEVIDTACSSSLVALQHACRSLRDLECELAIIGGVNAVLAPESSVYFSQLRILAKDGRCKTFDQRADGFVRSEGAGVVVLKPLRSAIADGDRIYALVQGGAVCHDGRTNGLLAPNGLAQQDVVRRALAAAGIRGDELDYVEAHGVGTPVADAVELRALGAVLSTCAAREPLLVGSAKTNVGHLEAASGMVGVIKVALSLHHEEVPPHLHLRDVHPDIGIDSLPIAIPTVAETWRRGDRPRLAGVSAFGFGGTNAHVILREAPLPEPPRAGVDRPRQLLVLSARTATALDELAARYASQLATQRGENLADLCFTASTGRAHFAHRLALAATDGQELREQLARFRRAASGPGSFRGEVQPGTRVEAGFVFAEADVAPGAGEMLYQTQPQFRKTLERCERLLQPHIEHPLLEVLYRASPEQRAAWLLQPSYSHAALVSLQYALHDLWCTWGLAPSAVYGAGAGEYAAAAASGVLAWEQAVVLAARRGLVLEGLSPGASQRLSVRMFKDELAAIEFQAPSVPSVSAALGRAFAHGEVPDHLHWGRHIYHAPRASDGRDALLAAGCKVHLELGPRRKPQAGDFAAAAGWLTTLDDAGDDWSTTLDALAELYVRGVDIDWRAFDAPYPRRKLSLPTYPYQRQRYWLDFPNRSLGPVEPAVLERPPSHPLISSIRVHAPARSGFVRRGRETGESGEGSAEGG